MEMKQSFSFDVWKFGWQKSRSPLVFDNSNFLFSFSVPLFHSPHSKSLLLLMVQEFEEREVEGKMMTLSTSGLVPIIDVSTYPIS